MIIIIFSVAIQMEDQAEPGLFLPHDVRSEQRGLLRPGTSEEKKACLHSLLPPLLEPHSLIHSLIPLGHVQVSSLFLARAKVQFGCVYMKVAQMQMWAFDTPAPRTRRKLLLFSQSRLVFPSRVCRRLSVAQPSRSRRLPSC